MITARFLSHSLCRFCSFDKFPLISATTFKIESTMLVFLWCMGNVSPCRNANIDVAFKNGWAKKWLLLSKRRISNIILLTHFLPGVWENLHATATDIFEAVGVLQTFRKRQLGYDFEYRHQKHNVHEQCWVKNWKIYSLKRLRYWDSVL